MPIIPLDCPSCGGNLSINSDDSAAICNFCGKPFVVKDAIVTNYIKNVVNINANTVNFISQNDCDIVGGVLRRYKGASIDVIIPETVVEIASMAFYNLNNIRSVTFPNSIKKIGSFAFSGCSSLSKVNLSATLRTIESDAFSNCTSLTDIKLPDSLERIDSGAFRGCTSLTNINIPNGLNSIGGLAFANCCSLTTITIPNGTSLHYSSFTNTPSLKLNLNNNIGQFDLFRTLLLKNNWKIEVLGGWKYDGETAGGKDYFEATDQQIYNGNIATLVLGGISLDLNSVSFYSLSYFNTLKGNRDKYPYCESLFSSFSKEIIEKDKTELEELLRKVGIKKYEISYINAQHIKFASMRDKQKGKKPNIVGTTSYILLQIPNE